MSPSPPGCRALLLALVPSLIAAAATAAAMAGSAMAAPRTWAPLPALYGEGLGLDAAGQPIVSPIALDASATLARRLSRVEDEPARSGGKRAFLYSLLLPGLGEISMGERGRATGFLVAEGLIWTSFIYWTLAGDVRRDDYIEQARLNAGVGVEKGSDEYWRLVGQFERSSGTGPESYEEELRREARDTYPGDPAAQDAFVAERLPTGDRAWEWTSIEQQRSYRDVRENSNRAFNRAQYSFAAAILNRVVSVIDVQLLRRKAARQSQSRNDGPEYRLYADTAADGSGRVVLQRRF